MLLSKIFRLLLSIEHSQNYNKTNTALLKELMDKLQMIFELKDQISAF